MKTPNGDGSMKVNGVSIRYEDAPKPAVSNVSFTAKKGKVTVLAGPSGSGKTTMARALRKSLNIENDGGEILLGGVNIDDVHPNELSNFMVLLSQKSNLLSASILKNVRLLSPETTLEDFREALRKALILDELEDLVQEVPYHEDDPEESIFTWTFKAIFGLSARQIKLYEQRPGLQRKLGEQCKLSGGQLQRLSLAIAWLAKTPILILDEPTASLDKGKENAIMDTLIRMAQEGFTVIVVSHTLTPFLSESIPEDLVHFVLFEEGEIVQTGTREELFHKSPNAQFRLFVRNGVKPVVEMSARDLAVLKQAS